ncbi:MFS transporter [Endozoicomonas arenosclerae]|uniref:MFS transporter n=1 Tax=Endozoicomonas arenosclerae TaxID=1633495 RepID=UPI0007830209|nr:MFS transporter [Endozoicomonas arenosclerae]
MPAEAAVSFYSYWRIAILAAVSLMLTVLVEDAYVPVTAEVAKDFGAALNDFQLTTILLICVQGITMPLFASIGDRVGRTPVLESGMLIFIAGSLLCMLSGSVLLFYFGRILQGVGASAILVIIPAMIRDRFSENEAASQFSAIALILLVTRIVSPEMGVQITDGLGWRALFGLISVLGLIILVINHRAFYSEGRFSVQSQKSSFLENVKKVLGSRSSLGYIFTYTASSTVVLIYYNNASFLFIQYYQLMDTTLALILSLSFVVQGAASLINICLLKRLGYQKIMTLTFYLMVALSVVNMILDWTESHTLVSNMLLLSVLFFFSAFIAPNALTGVVQEHPQAAATASSVMDVVAIIISSLASTLVILLSDGTPKTLSLVAMAVCLLALSLWSKGD